MRRPLLETLKNLLRGASTVLDIFPPPRRVDVGRGIINRSDAEALRGDWEKVGGALRKAGLR